MKKLMFALVALIGLTAAEPLPDTGVSTKQDARKYVSYDYTDAAKKAKVRLVIPDGLAVVRGILVVAPFSGGDTRDFH